MHARLLAAPRGPADDSGLVLSRITLAYVATLTSLRAQIADLQQHITEQLAVHPDQQTFTSLPRSGSVRAARLLAEIGDSRARFPPLSRWPAWLVSRPAPEPAAKATRSASAGPATSSCATPSATSPATADEPIPGPKTSSNELAAAGTTKRSPSASCARAWLYFIWHCWQNKTGYDSAQHNALQRLRAERNTIDMQAA